MLGGIPAPNGNYLCVTIIRMVMVDYPSKIYEMQASVCGSFLVNDSVRKYKWIYVPVNV